MRLGHHAGLKVPATALVPMPEGMPPALLVERFDIRTDPDDDRRIALEDLCSVFDLPPSAKYDGTMERVARAVRPVSTAPEEDLVIVLQRALFVWLIGGGDMHLKNLALLKIAPPGAHTFESVRLAPLYDAVTTRMFPGVEHDRMALKLAGRDDRLRRPDLLEFAATAGITARLADEAIDRLLGGVARGLDEAALPEVAGLDPDVTGRVDQMLALCRERVSAFS